LEIVAYETFVR